ncbi:MAG: acetylglucosamine-6-sulfatase [Rhodothermaceae bacterium]|nr:MAG: acetylglucosamine-6-sulfatase [Rhodothermaceae bacterium]
MRRYSLLTVLLMLIGTGTVLARQPASAPRNVVFILSDDHRYDFMGFHEHAPDFLETPNMDRMAAEGAHLKNAFVTTSLCSPSRASILTGQYAHRHGIVDNSSPIPPGTRFFPADLQAAGYRTAFVGKWHMGEVDDSPQPGFDRWVSFRGQGVYVNPTLNIDGERVRREGYITDLLTDYALDWLGERASDGAPFFLYLSHKAVHAEFEPADRHAGRYADVAIPYPPTMANTESNYRNKPRWVREQRYSWHGVDYAYHGQMDFDDFYRRYAESLLAVDESIGRVMDFLEAHGLAENTLVVYMGDNGFLLGEHGLIDKRNAYEESIRVPMLAWSPGFIRPGTVVDGLVRNIDVAPTILELTGATSSIPMDGQSFLGLLTGASAPGDDREFLYEYYWEHAFPHTPTTFALRGDRFKYIYYHGIWDLAELYDLQADPEERHNLIDVPAFREVAEQMRERLFDRLEAAGAMYVPMRRGSWQAAERKLHD